MFEISIIAIVAMIGMITQRILGFSLGMFLTPILLVFFNPPVSITVSLFAGTFACAILLYNSRHSFELAWGIIFRLFIVAIPGLLLGSYIVTRIDKAWLQIIIGVLIIVSIVIQEYFFPKPTRSLGISRGVSLTGFTAGFLNGTAAMAAPPLVMYMRSHVASPNQIRQNLAVAFILMNTVSMVAIHLFKPDSLTSSGITVFLLLVPIAIVGNVVGQLIATKINTKQYHKMVFVAVIAAGIASIVFGAAGLI